MYYGETNFHNRVKLNHTDKTGFKEAKIAAKSADIVVMVLGEEGFQSGEGRSRTELGLPGLQQELLEEVYKVNKNIVLVHNGIIDNFSIIKKTIQESEVFYQKSFNSIN